MSFDPTALLRRLVAGEDLSRAEVADLFGRLMDGEIDDALKAGILVALAAKGEGIEELAGAAEAMRARVRAVPHRWDDLVDTCGTGGDGAGTFNISTAAAIVAASCGARVAKHGNRSVSSQCGSADVLEALGVSVESTPEQAAETLARVGISFLFAPGFHPAMREVMPVRRALGIRTLFNLLGPLTNPAGATRQLMGIYSLDLVEVVGQALHGLGAQHALVVHGHDGLDEITTSAPTRVAEVRPEGVEIYDLEPESFGIERADLGSLRGGDAEANAATMRELFDGNAGALADAVCLNAGATLYVAGRSGSIADGLQSARKAMTSGAAAGKLAEMVGG
jgi:anthranilate phosphoribosyltransferase